MNAASTEQLLSRVGQNQLTVKKRFSQYQRSIFIVFSLLFSLLFFQQTFSQLNDPYSGYTCDEDENCPWIKDSTHFITPGSDTNCSYTVYYKYRTCNLYLELQPTAVRTPGDSACSNSMQFYGDTLENQRMEQLLKTAERKLVVKFFNEFVQTLDTNDIPAYTAKIVGDSVTSILKFKIGFYRPACRGICISYGRLNSFNPVNSVYGKWYNCGTQCCELISYLAIDTINPMTTITPPGFYKDTNYIRVAYERGVTTDSCTTSEPSTSCPPTTLSTTVIRFKNCRNYCVDSIVAGGFGVYGPDAHDPYILPNFDKSKTGVLNLNEMPFLSEKVFSAIPDNILLETSNDIVVNITSDILRVKIVSLAGVELQNIPILFGRTFMTISLQSLQNGLYMLVMESKSGISSKPLIIAK